MNVSASSGIDPRIGQMQVGREIATRMARKTLNVAKSQGDTAVDMMRQAGQIQQQAFAAEPHKGSHLDLLA
jgi:hypothetical protein